MFPTTYFPDRYFPPRYFPKVGAAGTANDGLAAYKVSEREVIKPSERTIIKPSEYGTIN